MKGTAPMRCLVVAVALSAVLGAAPASTLAQTPPATPQAGTPPTAPRATPKPFPEGSRIAFMDPGRILAESVLGKESTAKMATLRARKLAELTAKNKELETAQQKLTGGSPLSVDARTAVQKSVDRLQVEIQRAQQDADAALQELQQQLNANFNRALGPIVERVALDKGVHMLFRLDSGALAWADPALDLTGDIIKRLDAAKAATVTKPPTKSP